MNHNRYDREYQHNSNLEHEFNNNEGQSVEHKYIPPLLLLIFMTFS